MPYPAIVYPRTNAALGRKLPYHPIKDFAPITQTGSQHLLLVAHPSLPVKTVRELIDHLKAHPGKVNYASGSSATALPMELFKHMTATDMQHIPYKATRFLFAHHEVTTLQPSQLPFLGS